jgi:hypothetical protein
MTDMERRVLSRLDPELSDEELGEANNTLMRYAALVTRIIERGHNERREAQRGRWREIAVGFGTAAGVSSAIIGQVPGKPGGTWAYTVIVVTARSGARNDRPHP